MFLLQSHPLCSSLRAYHEVLRGFPKFNPGPLSKEINLSPSDTHEYNRIIFSLCFPIVTWPACLLSFLSALALQNRWSWLFTLGDNDHPHHTQVFYTLDSAWPRLNSWPKVMWALQSETIQGLLLPCNLRATQMCSSCSLRVTSKGMVVTRGRLEGVNSLVCTVPFGKCGTIEFRDCSSMVMSLTKNLKLDSEFLIIIYFSMGLV